MEGEGIIGDETSQNSCKLDENMEERRNDVENKQNGFLIENTEDAENKEDESLNNQQIRENLEESRNENNEQDNPDGVYKTPAKKSTNVSGSPKVLIDINFRNKKTYFAFHEEFIEIIKKYYKDNLDDLSICDDASNNRICISEKLVKKSDSFLIDTTPNADLSKISAESTPKYVSISKTVLSNVKECAEEKVNIGSSSKCFNCDKFTHSLRDCTEPRNLVKIRKARNEFNRKELRYHLGDDNDEYSQFVPGRVSEDLKIALGLTDNQLPLHVYKMRKYGYPPSWLEEAKIYYSGLKVLDDKVNFSTNTENFKYDIQKIYEFPGFNVSPNPPFVDKHRLLNLPPMLPSHSKEEFILSLGDYVASGYKRQKIGDTINVNDSTVDTEEMDIENDCPQYNDTPKSPGEISSNSDHSTNVDDLHSERNKLLSELSEINDLCVETESKDDNKEKDETNKIDDEAQQHGHVETTIFGCPIIPSFTPFDILPSGDKFQEGVCDVIAFENLAESTGKYEKMKGVIKKVRVFLKEHQK